MEEEAQPGRYTLEFADRALERDFRHHQFEISLRQIRVAMVVLLVVVVGLNVANLSHSANAYSFGFTLGGTVLLALLVPVTFHPSFRRVFVGYMTLVGLGFATDLTVVQAGMAGAPVTYVYQQTLAYEIIVLLGLFFIFTLSGIGFRRALFITAPGALAWLAVAAWDGHHHLGLYVFLLTGYGLATAAGYFMELYQRRDFVRNRLLVAEQARSEGLLRNLLPIAIIERLKNGERSIADRYEEATILFEDVLGFTDRSAREEPEQTVALLNDMFGRFDEIAADLGLQPIKTTGDAYMVAGGVPVPRPDHAAAIAEMSLRMQAAIARINTEQGTDVRIRVGIHSGPVAAAVVGTTKLSYEVWGDTVNTASRMESTGEGGRIQVSAAVRDRLRDVYEFESRGSTEIKGKGPMETFFLLGPRTAGVEAVGRT